MFQSFYRFFKDGGWLLLVGIAFFVGTVATYLFNPGIRQATGSDVEVINKKLATIESKLDQLISSRSK